MLEAPPDDVAQRWHLVLWASVHACMAGPHHDEDKGCACDITDCIKNSEGVRIRSRALHKHPLERPAVALVLELNDDLPLCTPSALSLRLTGQNKYHHHE